MPKQSKSKSKNKVNLKKRRNIEPQTPGFTYSKSYWVTLAFVMAVAFSVAGFIINLSAAAVASLVVTVAFMIGLLGYLRVTPSSLSVSKRATFLFVGASVIGFGVWAAVMLALMTAGLLETVFVDSFLLVPSLINCLTVGAFIGELIGRNSRVQAFFFKPETL